VKVPFFKHRWQKISLIVLASFIGLVMLIGLFINSLITPILVKKLKAAVLAGSDSVYRIELSSAELHILRGTIVIHDARLVPNILIFNRKQKQGMVPNSLYAIRVNELIVAHIHPFTFWLKKKINIGSITLDKPDVQFSRYKKPDTTTKEKRTLWQKIAKDYKSIQVDGIFLNEIRLTYKNYTGSTLGISTFKELNLKATGLLIDSTTQTDRSRLLYCRDITARLDHFRANTADGLCSYGFRSATLSTKTSRLLVTGFVLEPISPEQFFTKSINDRITVKLETVQLNDFDYLAYHNVQLFNASNLIISHGELGIYGNYKVGPKLTDRVITFPQVAAHTVEQTFHIDTVTVKRVDVLYSERNKKSGQSGTIRFKSTSGRILNLTNNKDSLKKKDLATASFATSLMGHGKLDLHFGFSMADKANSYNYKGHLGNFDLADINPVIMPLAMIKASSGKVHSLDFNFEATNKLTKGKVTVLYNDLKVNLLRPDDSKKAVISFLANTFVINNNNPVKPGDVPRFGEVSYTRPYNSPFFKTLWQALLSGLKPGIGLGKAEKTTEPALDAKALKMQTKAQQKEDKKTAKAAKKEKRAADKAEKNLQKANEKAIIH
jgi:hypothetical protein